MLNLVNLQKKKVTNVELLNRNVSLQSRNYNQHHILSRLPIPFQVEAVPICTVGSQTYIWPSTPCHLLNPIFLLLH